MPPSPAWRCSPGRERRGEKHRRGHSVEYGTLFREKDDDLALFSEMQNKERESFLLQSSDDLEDAFSTKLKHFSDFTIPVRGERSELLNADGDKNDYDWLLTPPETPLFPSLDDDPPSAGARSRGRPRSQISLSRSSTMEKSHRSSKGSASPNRLSTSPRSGSMHQIRGMASSARHPSPTPGVRPATPVRRLSPSPSKPTTPTSRSSTPNSRRMSTGSGTVTSSAVRCASPGKSKRGNSASPNIKAWQSNIPGFSLDAPPNLRTSLADRPASYVRGSSPASRNGRDSASRHSRQSVSPIASRSVSSSRSHDRDRFSSHSKGSVASSGDDDLDSLQSIPLGGSDRPVSKRASLSPNNRTPRSSKLLSPSSAPKRSFESALRQMDHRKSHQNMFRPLVSSVPSTGFYAAKGSSSYHHIILRHSSGTTGRSASFDQDTGFMPESKGSEPLHVFQSGNEKLPYPDKHEENSAFGKVDRLNEGNRHESPDSRPNNQLNDLDQDNPVESEWGVAEEVRHHVVDTEIGSTSGNLNVAVDFPEAFALETLEVCSRCGCQYHPAESVKHEISLCPDCMEQQNLADTTVPETTTALAENSPKQSMKILEESKSLVQINSAFHMAESLQQPIVTVEAGAIQARENLEQGQSSYEQGQDYLQESTFFRSLAEGDGGRLNHQHKIQQPSSDCCLSNRDTKGSEARLSDELHDMKVNSSEGGDIALLIKRSSSMKSPIIQVKNFSAVGRSYEDISYARERSSSFRSSTGHGTASASSSVDYGSSRQKETPAQQQLSGKTSDIESHRNDVSSKSPSSMSSLSGVSTHACQALSVAVRPEDNSEVFAADMTCGDNGTPQEYLSEMQGSGWKEDDLINTDLGESHESIDISTSELSSNVVGVLTEDNSVISLHNDDNKGPYENGDGVTKNVRSASEFGESPLHARSALELDASLVTAGGSLEEHAVVQSIVNGEKDDMEISGQSSSATASEIELENCEHETPDSQVHDRFPKSESIINESDDCSDPCSSEKDMGNSAMEHNSSAHSNGILDESTVLVECDGGREAKSLTLEEATDTILFCSSIVHDLAYQAAALAIEKLNDVPLEDSRPTVTVLGKSNADRSYARGRAKTKRVSKSAKARHKQTETDEKACSRMENDENADESMMHNVGIPNKGDSLNPPKLESKCNCSIM